MRQNILSNLKAELQLIGITFETVFYILISKVFHHIQFSTQT